MIQTGINAKNIVRTSRCWFEELIGLDFRGKETDVMIGQCGLTMQPWKEEEVLEIGYLFERAYWHKGYAIEAAKACKTYAFEILKVDEVCSIIRDTNIASQKVAMRNGMTMTDTWTKHYRGVDMPHYRYVAHHSL